MAPYTLKLYRRQTPQSSPGALVGTFDFEADGNEAAIALAKETCADALAGCDHALISGRHGRVVWEFDKPA